MKKFYFILLTAGMLNSVDLLKAQTLPAGFSMSDIGSGWNQPVGAAPSSNGQKLFVWEKDGRVYVCNWDAATQQYVKQAVPVLDIAQEVGGWRDFGLLGFALDPDFNNNGLIYLLYVVDRHYLINFGTAAYNPATNDYYKPTIGRVTRYKTITNGSNVTIADPASRSILLGETRQTGIPILHESHGVGSLVFAADGTLLVSAGDGGCYNHNDRGSDADTYYAQALTDQIIRTEENVGAFRAQMINSMNGKVLRISPVTGNGISSNPFYQAASPRAPRSRVWAMGLRNPFRMSIRPNTGSTNPATGDIGELYIGDVGWSTYEELNIIGHAAANCGWPIYEGQTIMSSYANTNIENKDELNPLFGTAGCTQQYFYFQNLIKQATADNNTTVYNPCNNLQPIVSGANSNRFFHHRPAIDWQHGVDNSRIGIFSGNNASTAQIGSAESGVTGIPFRGNCAVGGGWYTGTAFPPAYRNSFFFGEYENGLGTDWIRVGKMKSAEALEKVDLFASGFSALVFLAENPLDGSLLCIDYGAGSPVKKINYGGSQLPVVKMTADKLFGPSVLAVNFTGINSYDPEGGAVTYLWDFGDATTSNQANPPLHNFTAPANTPKKFVVKLTVKDNLNLTATDSIIISVNNTPPAVNIISPVKNSRYRIDRPDPDTTYALKASVSDAEHQDWELKYEWQTILRHNTHEHAESIDTNRLTTTVISRIGCNGDAYYFFITLKVTDPAGLFTTDSAKIFPLCPGDVALPVILSSFSVNTTDNINLVKWTTIAEVNHKDFEVERSRDGQKFEMIHQQPALNEPGTQNYSFADSKYFTGINYYRVKMIDMDGTTSYTRVIKVMNGIVMTDALRVTPNPVSKEFTLSAYFPAGGPVRIRITDVSGKTVKEFSDNVRRGYMTLQVYQLEKMKPGTYFIEVVQKDYTKTTKFIKAE